ncbi:MAG: hypothetical protein AAF802_01060 [Planctomycetota bacterium]
MSVKLLDRPSVAKCPKCGANVRLPASTDSGSQNLGQPKAKAKATTKPCAKTRTPQSKAIDVPSPQIAEPLVENALDFSAPAFESTLPKTSPSPISARRTAKGSTSQKSFLEWCKANRLIVAIGLINIVALLIGLFHQPMLQLCLFQIPSGALFAALLFLPRKHLMKRLFDRYKARAASLGAGGVALVGAAIIARIVLRSMRQGGGLNASVIVGMLLVFVTFWAVVIGFAYLWKQFGIFRVLAWTYTVQLCFLTLSIAVTGAAEAKRDADSDRRIAELQRSAEEAAERAANGLPIAPPPGFEPQGAMRGSTRRSMGGSMESGRNGGQVYRGDSQLDSRHRNAMTKMIEKEANGADPGEVLIVFLHEPDLDRVNFREAFLKQIGNPSFQMSGFGSRKVNLLIKTDQGIDDIANAIDFGTVTSKDEELRIIRVSQ